MNTIMFILRQTLLLGTLASMLWLSPLFFQKRLSFNADIIFVWAISLIFAGAFLALFCAPIAKLTYKRIGRLFYYGLGLCIGPVVVFFYLYANISLNISFSYYLERFWREHLIFSVIGIIFFAYSYPVFEANRSALGAQGDNKN